MKERLEIYTLNEILALADKELYEEYLSCLNNLATNRIARKVIQNMQGASLAKIYKEIVLEEEQNRSISFFNGDLVLLHESTKQPTSKTYLTCDFSGGIIYPGSSYLAYRPMLENISTNSIYVLKRTIKVETGYYSNLPRTISDLEQLQRNMELELDSNDGIDYSHFNRAMGGVLNIEQLKGKSKIKRRNANEVSNSQ